MSKSIVMEENEKNRVEEGKNNILTVGDNVSVSDTQPKPESITSSPFKSANPGLSLKQYMRQSSNEVTSSQESLNSQQEISKSDSSSGRSAGTVVQQKPQNGHPKDDIPINPLYDSKLWAQSQEEPFLDAHEDLSGVIPQTPSTRSPPSHKRVHSDPNLKTLHEKNSTISNTPADDLIEDVAPSEQNVKKGVQMRNASKDHEKAASYHPLPKKGRALGEGDGRSNSFAGTTSSEPQDIFAIRFNPKSDAVSIEVKPEPDSDQEQAASLRDEQSLSVESPLSEPSSPEFNKLCDLDHPENTLRRSRQPSNGNASDTSKGQLSDASSAVSRAGSKTLNDKKKNRYWYNVLSPTYKSRSEDFKKLFKDKLPPDERLIVDYSCALQKDILVHGRLYITPNYVCFYANIFRWETVLTIRCKDITAMTKEKTARVIPNAIQICTPEDKFFFTSFGARDKTHFMLFRVWQNALMEQNVKSAYENMSTAELWHWVHSSYGEELGLTDSDCDYVPPSTEEKVMLQLQFQQLQEQTEKEISSPDGCTGIEIAKEPADDSDSFLNGELPALNLPAALSTATSKEGSLQSEKVDVSPSVLKVPEPIINGDCDTDQGDTTEDDEPIEVEVTCPPDHDHPGFTSLEDVYFIPVDTMMDYLFSDSKFYQDFLASRKTSDMEFTSWPNDPDSNGDKVRNVTYTLALNYSIGPKSSQAVEKQIWYGCSKAGLIHVIDTETINAGVPYGDNFYVFNRYCITKVTNNKCRLRVSSEIRYKKSVWGLVKNFIEKNATAGIMENYNVLGEHLKLESERLLHLHLMGAGQMSVPGAKKRYTHKRKRLPSDRSMSVGKKPEISKPAAVASPVPTNVPSELGSPGTVTLNIDTLVKGICTVLFLLVLFNLLLFYKLSSLESRAALLAFPSRQSDIFAKMQDAPKSQDEWLNLLEQQQNLHHAEMDRWKEILSSSVQLLDHMKNTLFELQLSIERRGSGGHDQWSAKANS